MDFFDFLYFLDIFMDFLASVWIFWPMDSLDSWLDERYDLDNVYFLESLGLV